MATEFVFNVYFPGTGDVLNLNNSFTSVLSRFTVITDTQFKMAFDGSGTAHPHHYAGDFGHLFTYGLARQVQAAGEKIRALLESNSDCRIQVNVYGFSRGGAAAFLLAKKLNALRLDLLNRLEINIAALDPVPGNAFNQVKFDIVGHTLASTIWDLSHCKINKLLILYSNKPVKATNDSMMEQLIAEAHSPILPSYPHDCSTEIDIIRGSHLVADNMGVEEERINFYNANALIVFSRIKTFLESCNTQFNFKNCSLYLGAEPISITDKFICELYESVFHQLKTDNPQTITRLMHKNNYIYTSITENTKYLNWHHKQLSTGEHTHSMSDDIALVMREREPQNIMGCSIV